MKVILDDCSVYFDEPDILALSDTHLGTKKKDEPYPKMEHQEISDRIVRLISLYKPSTILFNGDIFSQSYIDESSISMFDSISERVDSLIFTVGNHEIKRNGYPDYVKDNYKVVDIHRTSDMIFHHGHERLHENCRLQIIGHEHPIHNGEDVYVFHKCEQENIAILILPKFSNIRGGFETTKRSVDSGSPEIDQRFIDDFDILREGEYQMNTDDFQLSST